MSPGTRRALKELVEKAEFRPLGRNAHLQTLGAAFGRRVPESPSLLEVWNTSDDDFLRVHRWDRPEPVGMALLLHGLEGSARSPYVRGVARALHARGFSVYVMEHRSCGGPMNRARRLYHSGETTDLDFVVRGLVKRHPELPLTLFGVSLGGNQIAKWLGTHEVPSAVAGAVVVSPPFDLVASGAHMDRSSLTYVRYFLRTLIPKAVAKEAQYPGCVDIEAVRRATNFESFDEHGTAALHGFASARDYYERSSCGRYLEGIRVPTLFVAAEDDPFNPGETIPRAQFHDSEWLHGLFPRHGGHVGFMGRGRGGPTFWLDELAADFSSTVVRR
ncbi:MAG: alpha/beta fold hydrolase [Myxococcota bacterium]